MIETRASEAKGPFPGGKRVGSWGKKKRNGWNNSKREEGWELGEEKERKSNRKRKVKKVRSCNREQIFGVVLVEYKRLALQQH